MKHPWTAFILGLIWLATMIVILGRANLAVNYILLVALVGSITISFLGFR